MNLADDIFMNNIAIWLGGVAKWDILEIGNAVVAASDIWAPASDQAQWAPADSRDLAPPSHSVLPCYTCHKGLTRIRHEVTEHHAETLRPGWPCNPPKLKHNDDPITGSGAMSSMWWTPLVSPFTTHHPYSIQHMLTFTRRPFCLIGLQLW